MSTDLTQHFQPDQQQIQQPQQPQPTPPQPNPTPQPNDTEPATTLSPTTSPDHNQQPTQQPTPAPETNTNDVPQPPMTSQTASGLNPGLIRSNFVSRIVSFLQKSFSTGSLADPAKNIDLVKIVLFLEQKGCFSAEIAEGFARVAPEHFITPLVIRAAQKGFLLSQYVYCYLLILSKREVKFGPNSQTTPTNPEDPSQPPHPQLGMNVTITQDELDLLEAELNQLQAYTDVVYVSHEVLQKSKNSSTLRTALLTALATVSLFATAKHSPIAQSIILHN